MARSLYFVSGVLVRFPYSKRLFAICGDIRAASLAIGEVLSPFRPVQAVIPGRLVSPDMDSASPWEFHLRLFVRSRAFPESVPSSELRGGSIAFAPLRFTCGDFAPPLPGVAGRPTGRLASPDMAFVSPSASHLRLSLPFALSNPVPNYTQLSVRGVVRPPMWPHLLRVPWRSEKSFRLCRLRSVSYIALFQGRLASPGMGDGIRRGGPSCLGSTSFEVSVDFRNKRFASEVK